MYGAAAIFLGITSFIGSFEEKLTRRVKQKRLSFITQFKIEFLLPFTSCRKVLRKISACRVCLQIAQSYMYALKLPSEVKMFSH